ncbi:MAG: hypothetical protein WCD40_11080, partial [Candidatus Acidiferrales bacterium]
MDPLFLFSLGTFIEATKLFGGFVALRKSVLVAEAVDEAAFFAIRWGLGVVDAMGDGLQRPQ